MLLVRQVARRDGALLCAVKLLPDGALRLPCWQLPLDGATGSRGESPRIGSRGAATSSAGSIICLPAAGRRHCSSKSPRARILVLGTSGAHWPARWPRFELTERVAKSHLSGY